jgi:hypothetical protein
MEKKTLFITCFYNGLDNTILGGRVGRIHHYINSLRTLLNLESDFVIYTSEEDKTELEKHIDFTKYKSNVRFIVYDLFSHPKHEYFQKMLNGTKSDRCYEIMHSKTSWIKNHITEDYDYYYWIDCGLSHGGLFPRRYRSGDNYHDFFSCTLFNPTMVENLNKVEDKLTILYGDQSKHLLERRANQKFYHNIDVVENCHIVGGMFGGKKEIVNNFCLMYDDILEEMVEYNALDMEEALYTIIYQRNKDMFNKLIFTTWHHEDSDMAKYNFDNEVYFYKIFEKLNNIINE